MFRCQISGRVSKPGEKAFKVITETRPKTYYRKDKNGNQIKIGEGREIVKELTVCERVYKQMNGDKNV